MSSGAQSAVVCSTAGSAVRSAQPPLALPRLRGCTGAATLPWSHAATAAGQARQDAGPEGLQSFTACPPSSLPSPLPV